MINFERTYPGMMVFPKNQRISELKSPSESEEESSLNEQTAGEQGVYLSATI